MRFGMTLGGAVVGDWGICLGRKKQEVKECTHIAKERKLGKFFCPKNGFYVSLCSVKFISAIYYCTVY